MIQRCGADRHPWRGGVFGRERAYKVKRAVCFPFMDFSTLARREEACRAEIAINKPNAPEIYLDTVAITRDKLGHLAINGQGEAIEWAVAMRRFDTAMTFDQLAARVASLPRPIWTARSMRSSLSGHAPSQARR
jgi:aminoglycoside phosphotransferase family enzyme